MGLLGGLLSGAIKVVTTPIAVVKDVVEGEPLTTTVKTLTSATEDVIKGVDDFIEDGEII